MASTGRSLRYSSRHASPLPLQTNGTEIRKTQKRREIESPREEEWTEPPLRMPAASFTDHKGLEKAGVLEGMMPLGSLPPARRVIPVATKGEVLRHSLQTRSFEAARASEEARSTPDRGTPAESLETPIRSTRSGSLRAEQVSRRTLSSLSAARLSEDGYLTPDTATPAVENVIFDTEEPSRSTISPAAEQEDALLSSPTAVTDPPPKRIKLPSSSRISPETSLKPFSLPKIPPTHSPFSSPPSSSHHHQSHILPLSTLPFTEKLCINEAIVIAKEKEPLKKNPRTDQVCEVLTDILRRNHVHHHNLFDLANRISREDNPSEYMMKKFGEAVKTFKRKYRTRSETAARGRIRKPTSSAQHERKTPAAAHQSADASKFGIKPKLGRPSSAAAAATNSPKKLRSAGSRNLASVLPQSKRPSLKINGPKIPKNAAETTASHELEMGDAPLITRSASSSSLSSVDEGVVLEPPVTLKPKKAPKRKRNTGRPDDEPDPLDEEIELRRKRLKETMITHESIVVPESNVRGEMPITLPLKGSVLTLDGQVTTPVDTPHDPPTLDQATLAVADESGVQLASDVSKVATPLDRPRKATPKKSARTKISPVKKKGTLTAGFVRTAPSRQNSAEPDNSSESSNNDFCSACGGNGLLLCCDGCERSFHFTCVDPPINKNTPVEEPWYCFVCQASQEVPTTPKKGLFSDLLGGLKSQNSKSFQLPEYIRESFEDVKTGEFGEYVDEVPMTKKLTREQEYNSKRLRDTKDKAVLCYSCSKSALGKRDILTCDYCENHWHLDCLNPPLASIPHRFRNPRPAWMCPLHAAQELRNIDPVKKTSAPYSQVGKKHRVRRLKNPKIVDVALPRGSVNNGVIELTDNESESSFVSDGEDEEGVKYRLHRQGVILDFIDKIKTNRIKETQNAVKRAAAAQLEVSRLQMEKEKDMAEAAAAQLEASRLQMENEKQMAEALKRRSTAERRTALNLVQFQTSNPNLAISNNEIDNLIYALEAEAPPEVVDSMTETESGGQSIADSSKVNSTAATAPAPVNGQHLLSPPSPPASYDQQDASTLSTRNREILLRLRAQIDKCLTESGVDGSSL